MNQPQHLKTFALLDDTDVMAAVKVWAIAKILYYLPLP
jgi:hypothetical protein